MNKFTFIFLLVFFVATLALGIYALRNTVSFKGQAGFKCPEREIPSEGFCPENQSPKIEKDSQGCIQFVCR